MREAQILVFLAVLSIATPAGAGFVSATYGNQQSNALLQATERGNATDSTANSLSIPYMGQLGADSGTANDFPYGHIVETLALSSTALQVDVTTFDRAGPSSVISSGVWLFGVTEISDVSAAGFLNTAGGYSTTNTISAILDDLTSGTRLFDSLQSDSLNQASYQLGGLHGSLSSMFVGSLDNTLLPGDVYRLVYTLGVSTGEAGADNSQGTGGISLLAVNAVPEPSSLALAAVALVMLCGSLRRRSD